MNETQSMISTLKKSLVDVENGLRELKESKLDSIDNLQTDLDKPLKIINLL